jgi:hypothetical protein
MCRRPSQKDKMPRQLAAAAAERQASPQRGEPAAAAAVVQQREPELDFDELFPGEPDKAVRELIDRGDRANTGV